mmetsp:Transcript_73528/g.224877  ORF Transcript_73528/g.224877 Transcript_73528/m.224877 type:complete len:319 (+) Transcript_73528:206-1162(+)
MPRPQLAAGVHGPGVPHRGSAAARRVVRGGRHDGEAAQPRQAAESWCIVHVTVPRFMSLVLGVVLERAVHHLNDQIRVCPNVRQGRWVSSKVPGEQLGVLPAHLLGRVVRLGQHLVDLAGVEGDDLATRRRDELPGVLPGDPQDSLAQPLPALHEGVGMAGGVVGILLVTQHPAEDEIHRVAPLVLAEEVVPDAQRGLRLRVLVHLSHLHPVLEAVALEEGVGRDDRGVHLLLQLRLERPGQQVQDDNVLLVDATFRAPHGLLQAAPHAGHERAGDAILAEVTAQHGHLVVPLPVQVAQLRHGVRDCRHERRECDHRK